MIYRKNKAKFIFLSRKIKFNSLLVNCETRPDLCAEIRRKFGAGNADDVSSSPINASASFPQVDAHNTTHGGTEAWTLPTSRLASSEEGGVSILVIVSLILLLLFLLYAGCCIGKILLKTFSPMFSR